KLNKLNHIKSILCSGFILLLVWSITPTHLLHELFATHHDKYLPKVETHKENLSSFTYHCDTEMPVVKAGFVVAEFVTLPPVHFFPLIHNSEKSQSAFFDEPRLWKSLRAPPAG